MFLYSQILNNIDVFTNNDEYVKNRKKINRSSTKKNAKTSFVPFVLTTFGCCYSVTLSLRLNALKISILTLLKI